jgi:glycosyltransferase involved in cell wall biosynthesis
VTKEQIESIYKEADVYCLATRGEGFGLTIAEASSHGLPCIVPNKGGHIDFLDKENNFLYDSYYSTVLDCNGPYSSVNMKYVESNIDSLREKLRLSYELWKQKKLKDIGAKSKLFVDNYLDDVNVTNKFIEIVERINNE